MKLKIDRTAISESLTELEILQHDANSAFQVAALKVLSGAYSSVSGLDQLGASHGQIMAGGPGSAETVLASYSEQILWLKNALNVSAEALSGQDALFARGMDIADTGGKVAEESVMFPERPAPRFDSFSFSPPMVRSPNSLDQLCRDFSGTNSGAVSEAQSSWNSMASMISEVSAALERVSTRLLENNSGEVFEQAALRIDEVAEAGSTFAQNARTMAESVGTLNRMYVGHRMQVFLAAMSIAAIKDPVERAAAESSFLMSFESAFQTDVQSGVPGIDNLMRMKGVDGAGGDIALGMAEIAGSGQALSTAGLTPQGRAAGGGGGSAAGAMGAGSFGTVSENLSGLDIGDFATMAASGGLGTSTLSNAPLSQSITGGGSAGGAGIGSGGAGAMVGGLGRHALNNGTSGRLMPASGTGMRADQLMGARTQSASAMGGAMPPMMGAAGAGGGGVGGGSKLNSKQATPAAGSGTSSAAGLGHPGGRAQSSSNRSMMPMMPMAGAGAGGSKNTGKVKSVTSAAEEDANIAALLGDRGPVVPGVIGDWVRG